MDSYWFFIRQLNTLSIFGGIRTGGNSLTENLVFKNRDELEAKMAAVMEWFRLRFGKGLAMGGRESLKIS